MPTVIAIESVARCPLCDSERRRTICRARDQRHRRNARMFVYSQCHGCGAVYQSLRPDELRIEEYYYDDYGPFEGADGLPRSGDTAITEGGPTDRADGRAVLTRLVRRIANRIDAAITRRYPDPLPALLDAVYTPDRTAAMVLDFGCGSAAFLNEARRRGWQTLGVDFLPAVVESVRRAGHRASLASPEFWRALPAGSVDVVRMNHVIEHLYHPRTVLTELRRVLRPGGRLHVATPNARSLAFRLFRHNWFPLECPRHVILYSPDTLRRLLALTGFSQVSTYDEVLTKDTARSLGYLLRGLGVLDDTSASGMMVRPVLTSVLRPPARIAALAGRADRFHVIARAT